ncbi:uncharacterized protein LOC143767835 [Ranitomeya variabilis]|uniref:uncharacterized protein LOC143767835 n=1 Tax=Ranitomeya variabilis TaxID=490064 RepID=UPI0040576016
MCPTYMETDTGHQAHKMTTHSNTHGLSTTIKMKEDRLEVIDTEKSKGDRCKFQKMLMLLVTLGFLIVTAVGVYILAQYFMAPLVYQGSVPLQDADVSSSCNDTDNEVTTVPRRKGLECFSYFYITIHKKN